MGSVTDFVYVRSDSPRRAPAGVDFSLSGPADVQFSLESVRIANVVEQRTLARGAVPPSTGLTDDEGQETTEE